MSTLLKAISDSDTVLNVSCDPKFPAVYGVLQLDSEIISYTSAYTDSNSSTTLYGCTRGVRSTSPVSHSVGTPIILIDNFLAPTGSSGITQLTGDVTAGPGSGSQAATVVSVDGSSAANVHSAELAANAATPANTASTIVKRDPSGNFSAGTITAALTGTASGNLTSATGVTDVHADANSALHGSVQFVSGTNVTLSQSGQAITVNATGSSFPLFAPDGSSGAPSYAFASNHAAGIWYDAAFTALSLGSAITGFNIPLSAAITFGNVGSPGPTISFDGTNLVLTASTGLITASATIAGVNGTPSTPTYSFTSDTSTGIYLTGSDQIGFAVTGGEICYIGPGYLALKTGTDLFPNDANPLAPTAVTGFVYAPYSSGGAPTGNPGNNGALFFDGATSILYVFSTTNGWRSVTLS